MSPESEKQPIFLKDVKCPYCQNENVTLQNKGNICKKHREELGLNKIDHNVIFRRNKK